ncbi:hypothetical protein Ddye_013160 [Dipteronia dyeriana]|uniref:Uncharacterized protein n=1 Tax=Dipteronia dyeriana TaxID=168575 RepID=A0AAE0CJD0_9ROSI|nr:hypothetical protein Ddye_013160 [Dipteronia dyeriana]
MSPYTVGYRFRPTDTSFSTRSLVRMIRDCGLYGAQEPHEIWRLCIFFTKLKKRSSNGSRICITVASFGTWAGEDGGEIVEAPNVVGFKKGFRYENPKSPQNRFFVG